MLRFRQLFVFLLFAIAAFLPRPVHAALIPRYDLESLCYMSTDAVEATLTRYPIAGRQEWEDRFTATVTSSIAGQYHPDDTINALDLSLYAPSANSQRCILFIARKEFHFDLSPSKMVLPQVVDMLLIDSHNRVLRYYQISNPGGLMAIRDAKAPPLDKDRTAIAEKWADVDRLRPLLSRPPHGDDSIALQNLIQARRLPSGPGLWNIISEVARQRLSDSRSNSRHLQGRCDLSESKGDTEQCQLQ